MKQVVALISVARGDRNGDILDGRLIAMQNWRHAMFGCKPRLLVLCLILSVDFSTQLRIVAAETARRFDGRWEANFIPTEGVCSPHTIELRVTDGAIGHVGDVGFFSASGEVSAQGQVDASIGTLGIAASARGQLSEENGRGTWNFPDRGCAGEWTARRLS